MRWGMAFNKDTHRAPLTNLYIRYPLAPIVFFFISSRVVYSITMPVLYSVCVPFIFRRGKNLYEHPPCACVQNTHPPGYILTALLQIIWFYSIIMRFLRVRIYQSRAKVNSNCCQWMWPDQVAVMRNRPCPNIFLRMAAAPMFYLHTVLRGLSLLLLFDGFVCLQLRTGQRGRIDTTHAEHLMQSLCRELNGNTKTHDYLFAYVERALCTY